MKITNRRAFFDYQLEDSFEAGINLYGHEVKSVRTGKADLSGSFVRIVGSEAYLVNAKIFPYQPGQIEGYDQQRSRKLLMHKKEIISLKSKLEGSNFSLVPVSMYLKNGFVKLEVALGRGKKKYDKRQAIKRRDIQRGLDQELA
ncbi:MAG: SsrA-binding protein SmpB [Candidatus Levybacteria bacterium]|nr:SsrA-binding protein SmpB [Candidatus Levybacteria bacterium]